MSRRNFLPYLKKGIIVIVFIVLILLMRSLVLSILSIHDRSQILRDLKEEEAQKKREQAYLSQKLFYAKTDAFVEEEARQKLGLVREGEHVVVDEKLELLKPPVLPESVPNWQQWWKLFF